MRTFDVREACGKFDLFETTKNRADLLFTYPDSDSATRTLETLRTLAAFEEETQS